MRRADAIWTIALKELSDRLRNRWIWTVSLLVLATSLAIAYLGAAPVGVVGAHGAGVVMASILNLAVYLVPLLALVMGAGAIIEEKRRGLLDLILAYPVSSTEYFLGTFLGHVLALVIALLASFVPTGVVLRVVSGINVLEFALLLVLVLGLGTAFLAISFLISILSRDPARGVASSVLVWILAVLVFDLALVGLLVASGGAVPESLFGSAMLLNPTDIFRLIAFSWVGSAASPLGLATVSPPFPRRGARQRARPLGYSAALALSPLVSETLSHGHTRMNKTTKYAIVTIVSFLTLGVGVSFAGELKGRVETKGKAPAVVFLKGVAGGTVPSTDTVITHTSGGKFEPAVTIGFVGNDFVFRNEDDQLHTTHLYLHLAYQKEVSGRPIENGATLYNIALPIQGMEVRRPIKSYHHFDDETGVIDVRCNPHPQESAATLIFDHPFAAVADASGAFSIPNVPAGNHEVWVWLDGEARKWKSVDVKASGSTNVVVEIGAP